MDSITGILGSIVIARWSLGLLNDTGTRSKADRCNENRTCAAAWSPWRRQFGLPRSTGNT